MPNYRRPRIPGATVFFTVCLSDRTSDVLIRHVDVLRNAVRRAKEMAEFDIVAWVTLPDHFHCILTLSHGDSDYSKIIGGIKAQVSRDLRRAGVTPPNAPNTKGEVGLWQKRFWEHHVRDAAELERLITYCNMNPVKHGLVSDPFDWPQSSIHRDMRQALRDGVARANRLAPVGRAIAGPGRGRRLSDPHGEPQIRPTRANQPGEVKHPTPRSARAET